MTREQFFSMFARIPLDKRSDIAIVLDERPMSWNVAFFEVKQCTNEGNIILDRLENMDFPPYLDKSSKSKVYSTQSPTVAFDVDGTLLSYTDLPIGRNINLLKTMKAWGFHVTVWSGGGRDWAKLAVERLGLETFVDRISSKTEAAGLGIDLTFDDETVLLGKVNIKV